MQKKIWNPSDKEGCTQLSLGVQCLINSYLN